jgi:hypothetical protein
MVRGLVVDRQKVYVTKAAPCTSSRAYSLLVPEEHDTETNALI